MALALSGVRIWDGASEALRPGLATLRIEDGRIVGIGDSAELERDAERIELRGAVALPGLCDAHVHLTLDPARREAVQDASGDPLETMAVRARAMVEAGITTARDLGGPEFRALELRDRIASGELVGPRLLCAGQPLTSPQGHCWFWGGEASGADELRAVVRRQVERGADWIKVMATGGVLTKGTTPRAVAVRGGRARGGGRRGARARPPRRRALPRHRGASAAPRARACARSSTARSRARRASAARPTPELMADVVRSGACDLADRQHRLRALLRRGRQRPASSRRA